MAGRILTYSEKDTWIHRLSGVSKMIFFLLWSLTGMLTYDTRVLLVMLVCSLVIFKVSHTEWKQVGTVFQFILLFLCINMLAVWLFSPNQGTVIYGTKTELLHLFGNHNITKEQLFYQFNIMLKYLTVTPVVLMFIVTTNPSEFAASLNRMGVSYNVGYAIAIVPGLLLGGIIQTCDRLLGDLKEGKFPPVTGSPGKTFARFGAAEWDQRRTAFRDPIKEAAE